MSARCPQRLTRLERGTAKEAVNENFLFRNPLRSQLELTKMGYNWVMLLAVLGLWHQSGTCFATDEVAGRMAEHDRTVCTACGQQMTIICRDPLRERLTPSSNMSCTHSLFVITSQLCRPVSWLVGIMRRKLRSPTAGERDNGTQPPWHEGSPSFRRRAPPATFLRIYLFSAGFSTE